MVLRLKTVLIISVNLNEIRNIRQFTSSYFIEKKSEHLTNVFKSHLTFHEVTDIL